MHTPDKTARRRFIIMSALFALAALASIAVAKKEYVALQASENWGAQAFIQATAAGSHLALSTTSDQYVITGCLRVVSSANGRFLPADAREKLLAACSGLARAITASAPQNSYAWFARAYFAYQQNTLPDAGQALRASYQTGPNEQWLAELRVPLAEAMLDDLSPETYANHLADLALLVQSQRGVGVIARRYVSTPGFRVRVTSVVETLPQGAQTRFLRVLKAEVQRFQRAK